jgi:DNA invertase Pin-like site-specific DNA recombinase
MRVAIYARVATDEQEPENQLRQLRAWCTAAGHEVGEEYIDHGVSGAKAAGTRTRFAALLADAHKRRFDMVLCWALDRLSREGIVATVGYLRQLAASGVSFHSYSEPMLSTDNELVRDILLAVMVSLAKQERLRHIERVKAGMDRARIQGTQSGKPIGRARIPAAKERAIRAALAAGGKGILKIAAEHGVGSGTVQRIRREMLQTPNKPQELPG